MDAERGRKEYMSVVIRLSRISVDACGPFLEAIPEGAVNDPGHEWWGTGAAAIMVKAMEATIEELSESG